MPEPEIRTFEEPDPLGAVRYEITYSNEAGEIVDKANATRFIAEGYDADGRQVASQHGLVTPED